MEKRKPVKVVVKGDEICISGLTLEELLKMLESLDVEVEVEAKP